jgi:MFS transporter, ACS family, pantothenate transporter
MIFWLAGSIGQLFSGFLQAAAYTNLNHVNGHAGWRWLFIIDGIITLPLAVIGFVFFPNLPQNGQKTWWTTDAEHDLSIRRLKAVGRAGKEPWSRAKAKKILLSWHTYLLRAYFHASVSSRLKSCADHQVQPCCTSCGTMADPRWPWATG